jgi:hypothetical protein
VNAHPKAIAAAPTTRRRPALHSANGASAAASSASIAAATTASTCRPMTPTAADATSPAPTAPNAAPEPVPNLTPARQRPERRCRRQEYGLVRLARRDRTAAVTRAK